MFSVYKYFIPLPILYFFCLQQVSLLMCLFTWDMTHTYVPKGLACLLVILPGMSCCDPAEIIITDYNAFVNLLAIFFFSLSWSCNPCFP